MRSMFVVGAKLVGVVLCFRVASSFLKLAFLMISLIGDQWEEVRGLFAWTAAAYFEVVIEILFVFVLLFRTDWLAERLKVREEPLGVKLPAVDELVRIGIRLMGVYVLVVTAPALVTAIARFIAIVRESEGAGLGPVVRRDVLLAARGGLEQIVRTAVKIGLGSVCAFRPTWVMRVIGHKRRIDGSKAGMG